MDKTTDYAFWNWLKQEATEEERQLTYKVMAFGDELFQDMVFAPESCSSALLYGEYEDTDAGESREVMFSLPSDLEYFMYDWFKYKVESLPGDTCGRYNPLEQTLTIDPDYLNNDSVILHEMIHLHEEVLDEFPRFLHDMLYWALYQQLRDRIVGLDEAINKHAHLVTQEEIYESGGVHDILFLLKSFDLDIQMGYPLGTVFGYGRVDVFKSLEVISGS